MMKNKGKECAVPECEREAYSLGLCQACYARQHYWHRKTMAAKVKRIKNLQLWESSLEMQLGNVKTIKRATKRRRRA